MQKLVKNDTWKPLIRAAPHMVHVFVTVADVLWSDNGTHVRAERARRVRARRADPHGREHRPPQVRHRHDRPQPRPRDRHLRL